MVFILLCTCYLQEKSLKLKLQDEMAKAAISNGTNLSISEYDALVSKIKIEAAKAHSELLEAKGTIPKRMFRCLSISYALPLSKLHA